ncbi:MAG TPA: class I SAM-dependent methyltransferase [Pyrinomonadaceae bacterium]|nr:class I SAM-dependent methyltransferase [Pyrinomonadaceae bacterium]
MNFFSPKTAAVRYAKGRPFFHQLVIQRAKDFLPDDKLLQFALDVGCGTGLSSVALKEIAENIIGTDISREMIVLAPKDKNITYFVSDAENLPFNEGEFNLITISQAVHWLNRKKFFSEARRVLKEKGWLIIYDNYFSGQILENPRFQIWYQESYLRKYPIPPRNWASFDGEDTEKGGFNLLKYERIENTIGFSLEELTNFLLTLTNVIAAVEGGNEEITDVKFWLAENLKSFFKNTAEANILFNAPIWFLQRAG